MSRPPTTSRKVGRVLVLLALFLVCLRTTRTARAFLGAGAVQFPRSVPPRTWARNFLVARRAKAEGNEDEKASEKDQDEVEGATTEAKPSFDQAEDKTVEEAASAQTADPKDEQLQKSEEDLSAARRLQKVAINQLETAQQAVKTAQQAVKTAQQAVETLQKVWLQEFEARGNTEEAKEAEAKVEKAKQEREKAKEEVEKAEQKYKEAQAKVQAGPAQAKASPAVQELTVKDLNISQCTRPEITVKPNQFVELDPCVNSCIEAISENLPKSTDGTTVRVPPVMLSRCMRGGKTTVLLHVFERLQAQGKNPVFVSFNGDCRIDKVANEKPLATLLRAIAVALMNQKSQSQNSFRLRCSEEVLKAYLRSKTDVVLIIDELNVLLQPTATDDYEEVGAFLRQEFLDPAGRHLIFSTHVPSSAGLDQLLGKGGGSSREAVAVAMPRSTELDALRKMDNKCSGLTRCQAVFYGYMPSLIYSVQTQKTSFSIQGRFQAISAPTLDAGVTKDFLTEFFTGRRCGNKRAIRAFDALTECPGKGEIRWILAYVGCMLSYLELGELSQWVEEIPVLAEHVDSGMDWQAIVLIALALRCVQAKHVSAHKLLGLPLGAQPKEVYFYKIPPGNCGQPDDVRSWWKNQKIEGYPYVAVLSPNYAKAAVFDVIWVYQRDPQSKQLWNGIQDKLGSATPKQNVPEWFQNGFLFRGCAPEKDTTPTKRIRWTYKGAEDIREFLGVSLTAAYPGDWPSVQS